VHLCIMRDEEGAPVATEFTAPAMLELGDAVPPEPVAAAAGLPAAAIATERHHPRTASVGLPFLMAELPDAATLARARIAPEMFEVIDEAGLPPDIHMYVRSGDEYDIRARMFAPLDGVPEDPATGSANCALAALLAHYAPGDDCDLSWRILQGAEMGRPSVLEARAGKRDGRVTGAWIGGGAVMFAEGWLDIG